MTLATSKHTVTLVATETALPKTKRFLGSILRRLRVRAKQFADKANYLTSSV